MGFMRKAKVIGKLLTLTAAVAYLGPRELDPNAKIIGKDADQGERYHRWTSTYFGLGDDHIELIPEWRTFEINDSLGENSSLYGWGLRYYVKNNEGQKISYEKGKGRHVCIASGYNDESNLIIINPDQHTFGGTELGLIGALKDGFDLALNTIDKFTSDQ